MLERFPRRPSLALVGTMALVIATANPAAASPGDLDPTFDADGKVTTDFPSGTDQARAVAIQDDGVSMKIVTAGFAVVCGNNDFALARYLSNGDLDPTFNGDGRVTTDFAGGSDQAFGVAIQGDGKIVAAGFAQISGNDDFALARYNTNGSLDINFDALGDADGKVTTDFSGGSDHARALAIQGDGKIVAAGHAIVSGSNQFALARYNSNGSLDIPTFSGDGKMTNIFVGIDDQALAVATQGDGKIVAAGVTRVSGTRTDFALARYNTNGSLDAPTFDTDGRVTTFFSGSDDAAVAVAIQGDGKIVAAGFAGVSGSQDFALARYNNNGSLDAPTFDGDGKVTTNFAGTDQAFGVAIQGDGKIVAAGFTAGTDFALARYSSTGSLDAPTFDGDGRVTTDFGSIDAALAVAIQGDGKIVAAGVTNLIGISDSALARYNSNGSLDAPTFDGDGKVTTDIAVGDEAARAVAIQGDGKIVAAGSATACGNGDFAVARYNADGSLDTTFSGDGKVTTDFAGGTDQAFGVAIQGDGKIVAAGSAFVSGTGDDFALARYNTNGTLDIAFDGDGKATTHFPGGSTDQARAVAIQGDEKIVAAGFMRFSNGSEDFALARYVTTGALDAPTFSGDGLVTTDFTNIGTDRANGVAIQGDGKIVAAGNANSIGASDDFALARYINNGTLDIAFDGDGKATTDFAGGEDGARAVAIQGDGKIVAAGSTLPPGAGQNEFALARYTDTNGTLDIAFSGDGKVTTDFTGGTDVAEAVAIQGDGKIVAAGVASFAPSAGDFAVARYINTNGTLDVDFSGDGKVTTDFAGATSGGTDVAEAVAIQGDGKIVAAGSAVISGNEDFALARYQGQVAADLAITKIADKQRAAIGRNLTYTVTVTNNGPDPASGVIVTDTLPPSVTFVSATPPCTHSAGVVTCNVGAMGIGATPTLQIVVRPNPPPGLITNTASVTASTNDPVGGNNSASVQTQTCRLTTRPTTRPCS